MERVVFNTPGSQQALAKIRDLWRGFKLRKEIKIRVLIREKKRKELFEGNIIAPDLY